MSKRKLIYMDRRCKGKQNCKTVKIITLEDGKFIGIINNLLTRVTKILRTPFNFSRIGMVNKICPR
jgi:hypothetical protein